MKKSILISSMCFAAVLILFMATEPTSVPSFILVLPFLLIYIVLLSLFSLLLQKRGLTARRSWRIGALSAAIPVALLILQSIGQLTVRDLLTIAALFLLSYFYITRTATPS